MTLVKSLVRCAFSDSKFPFDESALTRRIIYWFETIAEFEIDFPAKQRRSRHSNSTVSTTVDNATSFQIRIGSVYI